MHTIIILLLSLFLRIYSLNDHIAFHGDAAWFYFSARDTLTGKLPLLGITTSVTWLHQGPLWTYLLAPALLVSRYHPASGAFLTVFLNLLTYPLVYFLARLLFNSKTARLSLLLFALSPAAVVFSRNPYHTSPISLFLSAALVLLLRKKYFLAFLFFGFLFQLELSSVAVWPVILIILYKQKCLFIISAVSGFLFGVLPMFLAGPLQLLGTFLWSFHRLFSHLGSGSGGNLNYYLSFFSQIVFGIAIYPIWLLIIFSRWSLSKILLLIPLIFVVLSGNSSEAYLNILLVPIIIIIADLAAILPYKIILLVCFFLSLNTFYRLNVQSTGLSLDRKIALTKEAIEKYPGQFSNIRVIGPGDEFPVYSLPYRYLLWSLKGSTSSVIINEYNQTVSVLK